MSREGPVPYLRKPCLCEKRVRGITSIMSGTKIFDIAQNAYSRNLINERFTGFSIYKFFHYNSCFFAYGLQKLSTSVPYIFIQLQNAIGIGAFCQVFFFFGVFAYAIII